MWAQLNAGSSTGINTMQATLLPPKHTKDAQLPLLKGLSKCQMCLCPEE